MSYDSLKSAAREAAKGIEQVREAVRLGFQIKKEREERLLSAESYSFPECRTRDLRIEDKWLYQQDTLRAKREIEMHTALAHEYVKNIKEAQEKGVELNTWVAEDKETLCWVILQLDRELKLAHKSIPPKPNKGEIE